MKGSSLLLRGLAVATTGLLLLAGSFGILAQDYRQFPGAPFDDRTLRMQERVEGIFLSGEYARALLIYEKELAPRGDKYAQYMVGFMHLNGKGVPKNPGEALAWYRLAAERGEKTFMKARDTLLQSVTPDELRTADTRFAELWKSYSDRKLLLDLIRSDLDILQQGRWTGDDALSMTAGGTETGQSYFRRVAERVSERLEYLSTIPDAADAGINGGKALARLEDEVRQELKALDLR